MMLRYKEIKIIGLVNKIIHRRVSSKKETILLIYFIITYNINVDDSVSGKKGELS